MEDSRSVSFITGQLGLGGAEKQLCLLIQGLSQLGWRVSVITLNPGKGDYWEGFLQELGVPVIPIAPGFPARRMVSITRQLRRQRPRIAHGWVYHANPYASLCGRLAGVPVRLGSVRGNPEHWPSSRLLRLTALFGPSAIVTNSQAAVDALSRLNGRYLPPLRVVPNASTTFTLLPSPGAHFRTRRPSG